MNTQVGKSVGIALLLAAGLIAALFAWGAFPVGAQNTNPTISVTPTSSSPGGRITVSGSGFTATAAEDTSTVTLTLETTADGTGGAALGEADVASDGTFEVIVLLNDTALATHKYIKGVGTGTRTGESAVEQDSTPFSVTIEPVIRSLSPTKANNAVVTTVNVTTFGFSSADGAGAVTITATDSAGDAITLSGDITVLESEAATEHSSAVTVPAATPKGMATITATQGTTTATKMLEVVAPTIMLTPTMADNSVVRTVTVKGTNFAASQTELVVLTLEDSDGDAVTGLALPVTQVDTTATGTFTAEITVPAGQDAETITIKASLTVSADTYEAEADFTLNPAPPAQVMGVVATPGEGSLAVTWTQVAAVNRMNEAGDLTLEKRPAAGGYKVEWKEASSPTWAADDSHMVNGGSQAYHLITGLTPDVLYMVRVSATNADTADGQASAVDKDAVAAPLAVTPDDPDPLDDRPDLRASLEATDSNTPGGNVRVRLAFHANKDLGIDDKIVIDFGSSAFGVPDSIDEDKVDLRVWGSTSNDGETRRAYEGHPADVTISGSKVTLILGASLTNSNADPTSVSGIMMNDEVNITFRESVGITNPTSAKGDEGDYRINIDADRDMGRTMDDDGDYIDRNYGMVVRKVSVDPTKGNRDDEITVTGKGFGAGTATVFLDKDGDGEFESTDTILMRNVAIAKGSFEATLTVGDSFAAGANTINAVDGAGNTAKKDKTTDNAATFTVNENVVADPAEAALAEEVTIKVSDWSAGAVDAVHFGGIGATIVAGSNNTAAAAVSDGEGQLKITVPPGARIGVNKVNLLVNGEVEGSVNVTVKAQELTVDPSSVVPGQSVTITGSDFTARAVVSSINFGGAPAILPTDVEDRRVTTSGRIAITVDVPLNVKTGERKVVLRVGGKVGESTVTVAEPSITVSPAESLVGSIIGVTGSGFASDERIEVFYEGSIEAVGKADGSGDFNVRFEVPDKVNSDTDNIGRTNKVEVKVRNNSDIKASADHKTPDSMIEVTQEAQAGSKITITGSNFKSFSVLDEVKIGGENVKPSPAPETDKNGRFEFEARVPRLSVGSHTVTVKDGAGNSATEAFTVVDTPIVSTPQEVFDVLGENLKVVWRYKNADQSWAAYDPSLPAELNDLTGVSRGDIVWVELREAATFQGDNLIAGWSLVSLE